MFLLDKQEGDEIDYFSEKSKEVEKKEQGAPKKEDKIIEEVVQPPDDFIFEDIEDEK